MTGIDQNGLISIAELSQLDDMFLVMSKDEIYNEIYQKVCTATFTHWGFIRFDILGEDKHVHINANVLEEPYKGKRRIIQIKLITKENQPEYFL